MASAADECEGKPDAAQCYVLAGRAVLDTNPGEAAKLFLASYRLEPKIDPLASYGLALSADHQYAAAAEALEKAVQEYDKITADKPEVDAQTTFAIIHRIKAVKDELARITPQIGWVQINTVEKGTLPAGYTIIRKGGTDLRSSDPTRLVVKAKGDTLVITYPSGKPHEFPVNVAGGALTSFDIPAEPPDVVEKPPEEEPPPPEDPAEKLRLKAYVAGGAGGALFISGIVYTLAAEDPIYPISIVLIGAGLAGLGIGGYWYYQAENMPKPAAPETALVPTFDTHSVGAALVGTF